MDSVKLAVHYNPYSDEVEIYDSGGSGVLFRSTAAAKDSFSKEQLMFIAYAVVSNADFEIDNDGNVRRMWFPITSLSRADISDEIGGVPEKAMKLTDAQMDRIASKMADDYLEQLYWSSLEIIGAHVAPEAFVGHATDEYDKYKNGEGNNADSIEEDDCDEIQDSDRLMYLKQDYMADGLDEESAYSAAIETLRNECEGQNRSDGEE